MQTVKELPTVPNIKIDDEVFQRLQAEARPFVDTPNSVLRRLLGLDLENESTLATQGGRAPSDALLPSKEYRIPILKALVERGGKAKAGEVIEAVGETLADKLTEADRGYINSGLVRWKNRVQFTRLRLVDEGLLASDSDRGYWAITTAGRDALKAKP